MKKLLLLLLLTPCVYAGSFDIGGKAENKANQFTASLDNSWEAGRWERDVEFNYRYKDANDIRTKNSGLVAFKQRLTFKPKHYVFGLTRYDYNEFRDIRYRTQVGLGYGYKLLRTERIKMSNEFSVGFMNNTVGNETYARNSVWFFYKVADKVNFTNKFLYEASDVPLLRNETAINFMLTDKLKMGISNIYTEDPHDDNVLSFNIGILF
jgi:putative salt-induced outer membrane protein YdiY